MLLTLSLPTLSHAQVHPVIEIQDPCGAVITSELAPPGSMIRIVGQQIHECMPQVQRPVEVTTNGITIEAHDVTLDLNARVLRSRAEASQIIRAELNSGIRITGSRVLVVNTGSSPARIEGFNANLKISADDTTVSGLPLIEGVPSVQLGFAEGESSLEVKGSSGTLIDAILIDNPNRYGSQAVGINASSDVTLQSSHIEGSAGAIVLEQSHDVRIEGNSYISGHRATGIAIGASSGAISIVRNRIADNVRQGVLVTGAASDVEIAENTIQSTAGCGIRLEAGAQNVRVGQNHYSANAGGNICH
jgi:hypothetical protein